MIHSPSRFYHRLGGKRGHPPDLLADGFASIAFGYPNADSWGVPQTPDGLREQRRFLFRKEMVMAMKELEVRVPFYPLVTNLKRLKEEAAEGVPYPFLTEELLELSPKDYRQFCSALGQRYAFETDIPKERYDTAYGAFRCSLVTAAPEKEAILLARVAGQMFGAYLPDKALLDFTGVTKKQVTLESCRNPEIRIGHPDAVR